MDRWDKAIEEIDEAETLQGAAAAFHIAWSLAAELYREDFARAGRTGAGETYSLRRDEALAALTIYQNAEKYFAQYEVAQA